MPPASRQPPQRLLQLRGVESRSDLQAATFTRSEHRVGGRVHRGARRPIPGNPWGRRGGRGRATSRRSPSPPPSATATSSSSPPPGVRVTSMVPSDASPCSTEKSQARELALVETERGTWAPSQATPSCTPVRTRTVSPSAPPRRAMRIPASPKVSSAAMVAPRGPLRSRWPSEGPPQPGGASPRCRAPAGQVRPEEPDLPCAPAGRGVA